MYSCISMHTLLSPLLQAESTPKLTEELTGPLKLMQDSARRIARIAIESKLDLAEDSYVESFRPHLMDVVHAWSSVSTVHVVCVYIE